jgi:hypothetical protein
VGSQQPYLHFFQVNNLCGETINIFLYGVASFHNVCYFNQSQGRKKVCCKGQKVHVFKYRVNQGREVRFILRVRVLVGLATNKSRWESILTVEG